MYGKELIAFIEKKGVIPVRKLKALPVLRTCNNWNKVIPLGLINYRTPLTSFEGALMLYNDELYFVKKQTLQALQKVKKFKFGKVIKVLTSEKK